MVSIIIPNYNHAVYLKQRIDSVLNQTFCNYELIILDDCSTDNSRDIIEEYRNNDKISHIIYNDQNSGSTFKQWERGIELAKGEYIWIAESDDVAESNLLEALIKGIEMNPDIVLSYCQSFRMDANGNITGDWSSQITRLNPEFILSDFIVDGNEFIKRFLIYKNVIPNASAVLFKKDAYKSIGGVDRNVRFCADWLLWLKIASLGDISFTSQCLNYFRYHSHSVIASFATSKDEIFKDRFDVIMRKKYQEFLSQIHPEEKDIMNINKSNIARCYIAGSIDYWSNHHYFLALKTLTKAIWYSDDKLGIIKSSFSRINASSRI